MAAKRSTLLDNGSYDVEFDDGTTMNLPPTPDVVALSDPMAGAVAQNDGAGGMGGAGSPSPYYDDPGIWDAPVPVPPPPPAAPAVETDAEAYARLNGTPGAGGMGGQPIPAGAGGAPGFNRAEATAAAPVVAPDTPPEPPAPEFGDPKPPAAPAPKGYYVAPTKIPGGPRTTGWNYGYTQGDPRAEELRLNAAEGRDMAEQMDLQSKQERAKTENLNAGIANRIREDQAADLERQRQQHLEARRAADDSLYRTQQRIEQMAPDPDKWWDDKSTGQQIGLAIALGLGELGGSMTGRENAVGKMIQTKIAQNIDAQKAKISQSNKAYGDQQNLYGRMLELHKNEEDATLATHAAFESMTARGLEQRAARSTDEEYAAESMRQAAAAKEREAAILNELHSKKVSENVANVPDQVVGGGWVGPKPGEQFDPSDPTSGMDKDGVKQYQKASEDIGDLAIAMNQIEKTKELVRSTDAGTGATGFTGAVKSAVPGWASTEKGRTVESEVGDAILQYARATGQTGRAQIEAVRDNMVSSNSKGDVVGGLDSAGDNLRARAELALRKYPKDVQDRIKRANPGLFEANTKGRAPGQ